jgi:myosin heavy subunit
MRISSLELKNCLAITELKFKPGKITLIDGTGKQGKTSILESIQKLFTNESERPEFVHTGAEKSETYAILDNGTSIKKYVNNQNKVTTVNVEKDGMKFKSAETVLKSMINENQLNPINLISMEDEKLSEYILSIIPIKVTTEDLEKWIGETPVNIDLNQHGLQVCKAVEKYLYDKRTDVNREVSHLKIQISDIQRKLPEKYNPEDWRNKSLSEKYEEIRKANENNQKIKEQQNIADSSEREIENLRTKCKVEITDVKEKYTNKKADKENTIKEKNDLIEKLKQEIALIQKEVDNIDDNCKEEVKTVTEKYTKLAEERKAETEIANKYVKENKTVDIESLEKEHKEIEDMKMHIRTADDLKEKEKQLKEKEIEANTLSKNVELMRNKPMELLLKAKMPVEGISVNNDGIVLINNRPIKNLSGTERIQFALDIVRASAGELKTILINGFEALSPSDQEEFIKSCTNDEFQYIITRVTDGLLRMLEINENGTIIDTETGEKLNTIRR